MKETLPQVDLQYPRASKTAAAPPTSKGSSPQAGAKDKPNPTFSEVLAASLRAEGETRAWFDEQLKYQYVRQTRVPLMFPEVSFRLQHPGCAVSYVGAKA